MLAEVSPLVAGIREASLVSSMLPWKGLGMSNATAHIDLQVVVGHLRTLRCD